jgi:hypothetical protein
MSTTAPPDLDHPVVTALDAALNNGALLCQYHHQQVEPRDQHGVQNHQQWIMRMSLDGYPDVIPPAYVDDQQRPRRHERFPTRQ